MASDQVQRQLEELIRIHAWTAPAEDLDLDIELRWCGGAVLSLWEWREGMRQHKVDVSYVSVSELLIDVADHWHEADYRLLPSRWVEQGCITSAQARALYSQIDAVVDPQTVGAKLSGRINGRDKL